MNDIVTARFENPDEELEVLLSEVPDGYKVLIKREEPEWARGNVGTFEFDQGEEISTEWLERKIGGTKLTIRAYRLSNKEFIGSRRVRIPSAPKKDGIELVPGPHGSPITVIENERLKAQDQNPQSQGGGVDLIGSLKTIMDAQNSMMENMNNMLASRVATLENLLTDKLTKQPDEQALATAAAPTSPQNHLKEMMETFRSVEEFKESMGLNAVASGGDEGGIENSPLFEMITEKLIEKFDDEEEKKDGKPKQRRSEPSNLQLANIVKKRLKTMDPDERERLLSHVLEDEEEETPAIAGPEDETDLKSLLDENDLKTLSGEGEPGTDTGD